MKNILVILFALTLSACTVVDTDEKYFYQLGWDQSVNLQGRYPATKKECQKTTCYRLSYDPQERLILVEYLDQMAPAVDDFLGVATVDIRYGNKGRHRSFYNTTGEMMPDYDGVYAEVLYFKPGLNVWVKQHQNQHNQLMPNVRGVYGYIETLNQAGVKIASQPLNQNFKLSVDSHGIAKKTFTRNAAGFVRETQNLDASDNLVNSLADGVAMTKRQVNKLGDVTRIEFYDVNLKPVKNTLYKASVLEWEYDERGNVTAETAQT